MKNEHGIEMTEKEIIGESLKLMADVCCLLFETETDEGHAGAYMADSLLKYLQVVHREDDVLMAACDYTAYEEKRTQAHLEELINKL